MWNLCTRTVVGNYSELPAEYVQRADKADAHESYKLQKLGVGFILVWIKCSNNMLCEDKAIWGCISHENEKYGKYATGEVSRSGVGLLQLQTPQISFVVELNAVLT